MVILRGLSLLRLYTTKVHVEMDLLCNEEEVEVEHVEHVNSQGTSSNSSSSDIVTSK